MPQPLVDGYVRLVVRSGRREPATWREGVTPSLLPPPTVGPINTDPDRTQKISVFTDYRFFKSFAFLIFFLFLKIF